VRRDEPKFNFARYVSTLLDTFGRVKPMHLGCVEPVEEHGSTYSPRRSRQARLET